MLSYTPKNYTIANWFDKILAEHVVVGGNKKVFFFLVSHRRDTMNERKKIVGKIVKSSNKFDAINQMKDLGSRHILLWKVVVCRHSTNDQECMRRWKK